MSIFFVLLMLVAVMALALFRVSILSWLLTALVLSFVVASEQRFTSDVLLGVYAVLAFLALVFAVPQVRRLLVVKPLLHLFKKRLSSISPEEEVAINAGTVWWEGELFSGLPNWDHLFQLSASPLTEAERQFLANEVEQLCSMLDEHKITSTLNDLPSEVWLFMRSRRFFGLVIPVEYGGQGFSAQAYSAIVARLASRSGTAAVSVMVPNSLGLAELIRHYGSNEQKEKYLRRLARGLEIPCLALTGPFAGSDAASMPDEGVVCRNEAGELGIRLCWDNRNITLAPVATLLGLAFHLRDPDQLLGRAEDIGITLALIPVNTPGVEIGRRHRPMGFSFMIGPTSGRNVFIPLESVIGGAVGLGRGWEMLLDCLTTGRSISLPASSSGGAQFVARVSGAYCRIRQQFGLPIGQFEGVSEALARIAGHAYVIESVRRLSALALHNGLHSSVISAIAKYHTTERVRMLVNDAMDVHGGKALCLGPSNYLASLYQQVPVGITVEGANILTRGLMLYGQGVVGEHPYIFKEMAAARQADEVQALHDFDKAIGDHASLILANAVRAVLLGVTGGWGVHVPKGVVAPYCRRIVRYSAMFSIVTEALLLVYGSKLKRHELISARMGDVLSQMYLASAVLKRHHDDGSPNDDLPLVDWAMQDGFYRIEQAMRAVLANLPFWLRIPLRWLVFPLGMRQNPPADKLTVRVAELSMQPGPVRDRLTSSVYRPSDAREPQAVLEAALLSTIRCEPIIKRMEQARRNGRLKEKDELRRIKEAKAAGIINQEEVAWLERDHGLRCQVIAVDDFPSRNRGRVDVADIGD